MFAEGLRADDPRLHGGMKLLVALRWRHSATVAIDRSARSFARLSYGGHASFRKTPVRVRFVACRGRARGRRESLPRGMVHSSFFPGDLRVRHVPACVPITIRIDRREPVHRAIGLGMHCPES